MSNPVPLCTHVKTNGLPCGSPAVSGTELCHHHSALKAALDKVVPIEQIPYGAYPPIPFVFPEDRASMQINFFLLLQAFNEQRIDLRAFNSMQRMLQSMAKNLGKSGSLTEQQDIAEQPTSSTSAPQDKQDQQDSEAELHPTCNSRKSDRDPENYAYAYDNICRRHEEERLAEQQAGNLEPSPMSRV
jgi:hypothetical protein